MRIVLAAAAALCLAGLACGSGGSDGGRGVEVRLDEFTVRAEETVDAGSVVFSARNVGQVVHELVVIDTDRPPDDLPVEDGEVTLDAPGLDVAARRRNIPPGDAAELRVELGPGRYVLICNVPAHYQSGMRSGLTVR